MVGPREPAWYELGCTVMRQETGHLTITTRGKGLYEFTDQVRAWLRKIDARQGLLTIFVRHSSASLLIQENADPDVRTDLLNFLERLVPEDTSMYIHTIEGPDDMPAHIRSTLTQTSLSIPVSDGHMMLGTWQGIYLFEHRRAPNRRSVVLHFVGE